MFFHPSPGNVVIASPDLLGPLTEGAGVDVDIANDDDEMSSVKKEKHRRRPGY